MLALFVRGLCCCVLPTIRVDNGSLLAASACSRNGEEDFTVLQFYFAFLLFLAFSLLVFCFLYSENRLSNENSSIWKILIIDVILAKKKKAAKQKILQILLFQKYEEEKYFYAQNMFPSGIGLHEHLYIIFFFLLRNSQSSIWVCKVLENVLEKSNFLYTPYVTRCCALLSLSLSVSCVTVLCLCNAYYWEINKIDIIWFFSHNRKDHE